MRMRRDICMGCGKEDIVFELEIGGRTYWYCRKCYLKEWLDEVEWNVYMKGLVSVLDMKVKERFRYELKSLKKFVEMLESKEDEFKEEEMIDVINMVEEIKYVLLKHGWYVWGV